MASSRDRQRKLARAKLDRQMARRAAKERRRRRVLAGVGSGVAVLLIVAGIAWIGGAFDSDEADQTAAEDICAWTPQSTTANTNLKDVGTPPTTDIPTSGTRDMTITTNQGDPIKVSLDNTMSPCGSADLAYLASKKFYDNTDCHEITTYGAIRCGDPSGTGLGGPTYSVYSENVPAAPEPSASASPSAKTPLYPKGTVALIGDPPGTNGSQFLIFFKDYSPATPEYAIVGTVTSGLETVTKMSKIATVANEAGDKVKPKSKITIKSLTVGDAEAAAAPSASTQS
ncbi:peptidyl-prolyl cis-trans isomerase (rotamase) [Paractinoplanes deccanensis]|uniref:Peptidyl-prolyl cis-trans isomerase (Rotamase) n=1 Tax=Paractinoplanes deccanensis TaxID=113561 RepID=A0ABQ3YKT5_9ACTN|nr:peptidylprolyl isomerase [Actinoplanes deccanensis]GID80611.1 peptidyl-prolyl cis-trans isomerase (rotamase) [Actinoplanes deccanensis]